MIGIYGANSFIGQHLVGRLAGRGAPVRAVSRRFDMAFTEPFGGMVEFVEADFRQSLAIASSLQDVDTVVQLVSTSSPGLGNNHAIADIQENVIPHVEFLQDCVRAGVKRYVFLSSGGTVYGPGAPVPTPETSPANPINSYGLTKLMVEKYIQMYGHVDDLDYAILRVANVFGPGQEFRKNQGLVPALIERWRKGQGVTIFGAGEARRDYIFIEDVIDAIEAVLALTERPRLTLNVGSGETRSVVEVIETVEEITGYRFERDYVADRNTDVGVSSLDISRAREVLGWKPKTGFREGVETTLKNM